MITEMSLDRAFEVWEKIRGKILFFAYSDEYEFDQPFIDIERPDQILWYSPKSLRKRIRWSPFQIFDGEDSDECVLYKRIPFLQFLYIYEIRVV